MKKFLKVGALVLSVSLLSVGGGVLGAAASDRLSAIFNVGQGAAGTKAMVFDSGNGSSNAQVGSSANTSLTLATGGTTRAAVSSSGVDVTGGVTASTQIFAPDGTVGAPGYSFTGDTDTGIYHSANAMLFSAGNARAFSIDSGGVGTVNGSNTAPSYGFASDNNTGAYLAGADAYAITAGGTTSAIFEAGGVLAAAGIATESSFFGYIKWKVFSGTLSASACTNLTAPTSTILGAHGFATVNNTSTQWRVMDTAYGSNCGGPSGTPVNNSVCFNTGTATDIVALCNYYSSAANDYRVVVYYQ